MSIYENPALIVVSACIVMFVFLTGIGVITKIMINKLFKRLEDANKYEKAEVTKRYDGYEDKIEKADRRQRALIFALKNMNSEWSGFSKSFSKAYRERHDKLVENPELEDD